MKIALLADVHGNLPALEAVMDDIKGQAVDQVICLGDMVGGANSKEAVALCQSKCDLIIRGNWEAALYEYFSAPNQEATDEDARLFWYINDIPARQLAYFGNLPHSTELTMGGKLIRLFHAHPRNFNRYHPRYSSIEQRMELFDYGYNSQTKRAADIAIYADLHFAYVEILQDKQLLNIGSVGLPLDIAQASYVITQSWLRRRHTIYESAL